MKEVDNLFSSLKEIAPECFFTPKYPYTFKFDLILEGVNYGELEVIIKKGLEIAELKGEEKALKKLDEINKKNEGIRWKISPKYWERINYPINSVNNLVALLGGVGIYFGKKEEFNPNKGFNEMLSFVQNNYFPINSDLLYKKTGIFMTD